MSKLKEEFNKLNEEEKIEFCQEIMPEMCQIFKKNPQKMMQNMMPVCKDMMGDKEMDMSQMMGMMKNMMNN